MSDLENKHNNSISEDPENHKTPLNIDPFRLSASAPGSEIAKSLEESTEMAENIFGLFTDLWKNYANGAFATGQMEAFGKVLKSVNIGLKLYQAENLDQTLKIAGEESSKFF